MNHALIIKPKWIKLILDGKKTWEIRGRDTKIRGKIGLIESGSGTIVGECEIKNTKPLLLIHRENVNKHGLQSIDFKKFKYRNPWIWELTNPKRYKTPLPYAHPQGAVTWVKIRRI